MYVYIVDIFRFHICDVIIFVVEPSFLLFHFLLHVCLWIVEDIEATLIIMCYEFSVYVFSKSGG